MENQPIVVSMPRFVFVHRINVNGMSLEEIPKYLEGVTGKLKSADRLPMLEYFVPVREGPDYSLTILDLNGLANVVI